MKFRALYKNQIWNVITLFFSSKSTGARLEKHLDDGTSVVEFPGANDFKLIRDTGLIDKNGVEIFEYDLIRFSISGVEVEDIVQWVPDRTGFHPFVFPQGPADAFLASGCVEVVGSALALTDLTK